MALPTLEKTWQFDVNITVGGFGNSDSDGKDFLLKVKNALIGFASGHWTVTSSSNGSSTPDLSDLWVVKEDIREGSGNHAWIVLTNSATGAQVCIDCIASYPEGSYIYHSPGGGYATTGLSTATRPTPPADESLLATSTGASGGSWSGKLHVMMSDDGKCTRVVTCRSNYVTGFWLFDEAGLPGTNWSPANIALAVNSTSSSDQPTYAKLNDNAAAKSYLGGEFTAYLTSEAYGSSMLGQAVGTVADDQSGGWIMCPIGLASASTGNKGRKGILHDIWWGSNTRSTGDTYPSDGSYQFVQFYDLILPWNGTLPEVA